MLWKITYCMAIILLCIGYLIIAMAGIFLCIWYHPYCHGNIIHGFIISIPLSKILPWFHYHCQSHIWTSIASLPWYMFYMNTHVPDINSGKPHRAQSSNKELLYTLTHCVLLFIICPIIILSVFWSILGSILALGWWGIITLLYVGQEYIFFTPCTSRFPHRICLSFRAVNFHFHCPQKVETFETFCYNVDSYLGKRHPCPCDVQHMNLEAGSPPSFPVPNGIYRLHHDSTSNPFEL